MKSKLETLQRLKGKFQRLAEVQKDHLFMKDNESYGQRYGFYEELEKEIYREIMELMWVLGFDQELTCDVKKRLDEMILVEYDMEV